MKAVQRSGRPRQPAWRRNTGLVTACGLAMFAAGCGAFNPAFVDVITGGQGGGSVTIPNPPGHVIVAMVNNTTFDEQLVAYLAPLLNLTPDEIRQLKPRVRMRVLITFADGSTNRVEFIDGTRSIIEPGFDQNAFPDLNQNDLDNIVVNCDVASVTLAPGTAVEVFIPVELTGFQIRETTGEGGQVILEPVVASVTPPQFRALAIDDVDEDGNVILRRNIAIRDFVTPAANVICGSVIAFTVNGALSVPFRENIPGFNVDIEEEVAGIGGRFSFRTAVQ